MASLLQPSDRAALTARLQRLRPDTPGQWGRLTAPGMVAHVTSSLRMMTGDLPVVPAPTPWLVRHAPVRHLLIYALPFPKGLPTSPELLPAPEQREWADALRAFDAALNTIGTRPSAGPWPHHPAFGAMSGREWGVLQYRHLSHHFRQFGV